MSKKPGYVNPHNRGRERNLIKDYRRQDETPVEQTQDLHTGILCPVCKGTGDEKGKLNGERVVLPCFNCNGNGVL